MLIPETRSIPEPSGALSLAGLKAHIIRNDLQGKHKRFVAVISGIAAYVKRVAKPTVKVIGVETVDGDAMEKSLVKGKRVMLDEVGPFADGTAVRIVGEEPFRLCKQLGDGIIKVNNDEICAAIKDVFEGEFCDV